MLVNDTNYDYIYLTLLNVGSLNDNVSFYIAADSNGICHNQRNYVVNPGVSDFALSSKLFFFNSQNNLTPSCNVYKASQYSLFFINNLI